MHAAAAEAMIILSVISQLVWLIFNYSLLISLSGKSRGATDRQHSLYNWRQNRETEREREREIFVH